jgi:hypothetical protein
VAEPRRDPARAPGRPPSDSLVRPTHRRLRRVARDPATTAVETQATPSRGWLLAVLFSAIVWLALVALLLWII